MLTQRWRHRPNLDSIAISGSCIDLQAQTRYKLSMSHTTVFSQFVIDEQKYKHWATFKLTPTFFVQMKLEDSIQRLLGTSEDESAVSNLKDVSEISASSNVSVNP